MFMLANKTAICCPALLAGALATSLLSAPARAQDAPAPPAPPTEAAPPALIPSWPPATLTGYDFSKLLDALPGGLPDSRSH